MSGEDETDVELVGDPCKLVGSERIGDAGDGALDPILLLGTIVAGAGTLVLLCRVGELEVQGEGTDKIRDPLHRNIAKLFRHAGEDLDPIIGLLGLLRELANALDLVEKILTLLFGENPAKHGGKPADIGAEFRIRIPVLI